MANYSTIRFLLLLKNLGFLKTTCDSNGKSENMIKCYIMASKKFYLFPKLSCLVSLAWKKGHHLQ